MRASIVLFAVVAVGMLSKAGKLYEAAHTILGLIMNHFRGLLHARIQTVLSEGFHLRKRFIVCLS